MRENFSGVIGPRGIRAAVSGTNVLITGRVANLAELRARFGHDDTIEETLARAFRVFGDDLQRYLTGAFALVLFDPVEGRGIVTHDALAVTALFYAIQGDEILFATDLHALASRIDDDRLDDGYFADYLARGYISTARTPYRAISRLLPGETLSIGRFGIRHHRSWDLAEIEPLFLSDAEYRERFRTLLDDAVRATLGSDGKTWVSLSGGLDSSTIAAVAARQSPGRIGAFSLVVPGSPSANEEKWMRIAVEHIGVDWHPVDVETALPFTELPDEVMGEPSVGVINGAMRRHRRKLFAAHGVTALLTGDGGDAIFGARSGPIPTHLADALFSTRPGKALSSLASWRSAGQESRSWTYWASRAVMAPSLAHLRGRQIRNDSPLAPPPWISAEYLQRTGFGARDGSRIAATRCRAPGLQVTWDTVWAGGLSQSVAAAEPYELRHPYYHRPLVEFMQAIPWDQKLRPNCDRFLQRHALKGVLPDAIRRRGDKTIGTWPFVEGLARSGLWQDYLCDDPKVVDMGFTTLEAWRSAVRQAASGQTYGDRYFLTMVAFEAWFKMRSVGQAEAGAAVATADFSKADANF